MNPPTDLDGFEYVVLRCVPRADREEFVNVGVVLHCQARAFLDVAGNVDEDRLRALDPEVDPDLVRSALAAAGAVCRGEAHTGRGVGQRATSTASRELKDDLGTRFGLLRAPRSTVVQPGPVHGGLTADPAADLARLAALLVR